MKGANLHDFLVISSVTDDMLKNKYKITIREASNYHTLRKRLCEKSIKGLISSQEQILLVALNVVLDSDSKLNESLYKKAENIILNMIEVVY